MHQEPGSLLGTVHIWSQSLLPPRDVHHHPSICTGGKQKHYETKWGHWSITELNNLFNLLRQGELIVPPSWSGFFVATIMLELMVAGLCSAPSPAVTEGSWSCCLRPNQNWPCTIMAPSPAKPRAQMHSDENQTAWVLGEQTSDNGSKWVLAGIQRPPASPGKKGGESPPPHRVSTGKFWFLQGDAISHFLNVAFLLWDNTHVLQNWSFSVIFLLQTLKSGLAEVCENTAHMVVFTFARSGDSFPLIHCLREMAINQSNHNIYKGIWWKKTLATCVTHHSWRIKWSALEV